MKNVFEVLDKGVLDQSVDALRKMNDHNLITIKDNLILFLLLV